MLQPATEFPLVGSYALLSLEGETHLARIQRLDPRSDNVLVSLPLVDGSSGNRTVHLTELRDGGPLSAKEARELEALCARGMVASLGGRHPKRNLSTRQRKRYDTLCAREARSTAMTRLLEELASRQRTMGRAA